MHDGYPDDLAVQQPRQSSASELTGTLAKLGPLEARLANSRAEIAAAQNLRFQVFFEEMGAKASPVQHLTQTDRDAWDDTCDHLLVIDRSAPTRLGVRQGGRLVATCRLMTDDAALATGRTFYSQGEFELDAMFARHRDKHFLELGRSCVLAPWRAKRTIELLWAAIWRYVRAKNIDVLIGCASFAGTDPLAIAEQLAYLHHFSGVGRQWPVRARPNMTSGRIVAMDRIGRGEVDPRRALRDMPPLIKGYLRLGAMFSGEAVIDPAFGTIDVLVVLPVERINSRYVGFYGANAERHQTA